MVTYRINNYDRKSEGVSFWFKLGQKRGDVMGSFWNSFSSPLDYDPEILDYDIIIEIEEPCNDGSPCKVTFEFFPMGEPDNVVYKRELTNEELAIMVQHGEHAELYWNISKEIHFSIKPLALKEDGTSTHPTITVYGK
jgi:hypothetical protein